MKSIKQFSGKVFMGLLMIWLIAGCIPKENNDKSSNKSWFTGALLSEITKSQKTKQGKAQVSMSIANSSLDVTRITVTVSGPGIATPMVQELAKVGLNWQGIINEIPTGSDRLFVGEAYDVAGTLLYKGQATGVIISFDQVTNIYILLQDLIPVAPFTNAVPVIDAFVASGSLIAVSGAINFSVTAHDPNPGDTVTYIWSATGGIFDNSTTANAIWTAPAIVGSYTIKVKVQDNKGSICSWSFIVKVQTDTGSGSITVSFNTWPVVEKITSSQCCIASGVAVNLTLVATDKDGDPISYRWSSICGTFNDATTKNPIFTALSTIGGDCTVTVNIADDRGGINSGSLTIKIKPPVAPVCADVSTLAIGLTMTDVCSSVAFTSEANTSVNGNITAVAGVTLGANSLVTGNVTAGANYTSGATSIVNGNVSAVGDVTLGAGSKVLGSVHSGTGVINTGAGATVGSIQ